MNMLRLITFGLIFLFFSGYVDSGESVEAKNQFHETENKERLMQAENKLNIFAEKHSAIPIKPFGYRSSWGSSYTATLQDKFEGKVVVFWGTLLDIVKTTGGKYMAVFGSLYAAPTTINLTTSNELAAKIQKITSGNRTSLLVSAQLNKIMPTYLEAKVCEEKNCNKVSIKVDSFSKSFQISGVLVDVE